MKGIVTEIERFAVHDGPGIRTVIFLKGCPLKCKWCSNPETQNRLPEIAYDEEKCVKCGKCIARCPNNAISIGDNCIHTDKILCTNCGTCEEACLYGARKLYGKLLSVEEVFFEVKKDMLFYRNSGGGVTLSGGEATTQPEFTLNVLKKCHSQGIHTAIESCLHVKWEILEEILEHLDLVYADIKHMNPIKCRDLTGKSNVLTLENIKNITYKNETEVILRLPFVSKHNDDEENIRELTEFAKRLNIKKIEILPYHRYGSVKYNWLGREYELNDLTSPEEDSLKEITRFIESKGIETQIGG